MVYNTHIAIVCECKFNQQPLKDEPSKEYGSVIYGVLK